MFSQNLQGSLFLKEDVGPSRPLACHFFGEVIKSTYSYLVLLLYFPHYIVGWFYNLIFTKLKVIIMFQRNSWRNLFTKSIFHHLKKNLRSQPAVRGLGLKFEFFEWASNHPLSVCLIQWDICQTVLCATILNLCLKKKHGVDHLPWVFFLHINRVK